MAPFFSENPYQRLLCRELEKIDCDALLYEKLWQLFLSPSSEKRLLHLHWLPEFRFERATVGIIVKLLRYLSWLRRSGYPTVWTVHNLIPHESKYKLLDLRIARTIARLSQRLIVHSNYARASVSCLYRQSEDKFDVIPHGNYVDAYPNKLSAAKARESFGFDDASTVLLFMGSIRPYKGLEDFVGIFKRSAAPNLKLLVAGKPTGPRIQKSLANMVGGDSRIIYRPGFVEDNHLQRFLNACDAVVFPYKKSLTSGAALLAMSFGKVCITYSHDGMKAILDEKGAIFIDRNDQDGLGKLLRNGFGSREKLAQAGALNLQRCEKWDWSSIAHHTKLCYQAARRSLALIQ